MPAYTKTPWIDKAVQYAKRYFINTDGGNDKNLLPPFTDWTKHANAVINSDYVMTLTASAAQQFTDILIPCASNQAYNLSVVIGGYVNTSNRPYLSWGWYDSNGAFISWNADNYPNANGTLTSTATSPSNAQRILVRLNNQGTGTFTFTNPQLELGTTATAFTPKKMYTITQSGGTVTAAGTPLNASNLNKMEQGIADALRKDGSEPMSGTLRVQNTSPILELYEDGEAVHPLVKLINDAGYAYISAYNSGGSWLRDLLKMDKSTGDLIYKGTTLPQLRYTNGYVEWNNGGTWYPMGDSPVGMNRTFANQASGTANTWTTVVNVTGVYGRLDYIKVDVPPGAVGDIKVTVDGLSDTITGTLNTGGVNLPLTYLTGTEEPIRFNNSLKIEIRSTLGGAGAVLGFYGYRLKAGTP